MAARIRSNLRKLSMCVWAAALALGVSTATRAAPTSPAARIAALVPASDVTRPPADALVTAWPLVSPCANPRWIDVEGYRQGTLFWSSVSGAKQVSFGPELESETFVLPASLTSGALDRLWISSGPMLQAVYVDCKGSYTGDAEPSIEWRVVPDAARVEVTARYTIPRIPKRWRLERWRLERWLERPDPFSTVVREKGERSRFWSGLQEGSDMSLPSIRLTRDALSDLRDLIASGCGGGRCARVMHSFRSTILEVIRDPQPTYERLDQKTGEVEPFGHKYEWRVSTKSAQVRVGCYVTSTDQILCELSLTTSAGQSLNFDAFYAEVKLAEPSGYIEFETLTRGETRVTISGAALALRKE